MKTNYDTRKTRPILMISVEQDLTNKVYYDEVIEELLKLFKPNIKRRL